MNSTKLYDLLESVMVEVGENTAEPYATRRDLGYNSTKYYWKADEVEGGASYVMKIFKKEVKGYDKLHLRGTVLYDIAFGVLEDEEYDFVDYHATNKTAKLGNMRRVMATVISSLKKEIQFDIEDEQPPVSMITMQPTKETNFDDRRANVYMAYIKKNMPAGSRVEYQEKGNTIVIELPINK